MIIFPEPITAPDLFVQPLTFLSFDKFPTYIQDTFSSTCFGVQTIANLKTVILF